MSSALDALLAIPGTLLVRGEKDGAAGVEPATTLGDLRGNKAVVYDFWTTRCTNCPAALDALDAIASARPSLAFVGVNIDDAGLARELVAKAASEGRWTSLVHAHLGEDEKEKAKDILGMRTVPFYVVVGEDGTVLRHGNAKTLPLKSAASLDAVLLGNAFAAAPSGGGGGGGGEGEQQKENDATAANASAGAAGKAAPLMECEGGVCKLVRKPKKKAAPEEPAAATAGEGDATPPATTPAPAPASATRAMECEGGVCKLVRKPKKAAPEEQVSKEPVAAAAVPAAATSASTRTVECEGGVCKLVRKPKKEAAAAAAEAAVAAAAKKPEEAGAGQSTLAVGDMIPSLQVMPLDEGAAATTLDDVRAGGRAVVDFWTTRCVRCPAALDALEGLAAAETGGSPAADAVKYISLNLDNLEEARGMVSGGRWPSLSHLFAGGHDEDSETLLETFKARAGLKSVPFYVVVAGDGRIEQIGGPKAVKVGTETATSNNGSASASAGPAAAAAAAAAASSPKVVPEPATAAPVLTAAPAAAPKATAFTMDEDF